MGLLHTRPSNRAGMLGLFEERLGYHGLGHQFAHRLPLVGQLSVLGRAQLGAQPVVEQRALLRLESREVGNFRRAARPYRSPPPWSLGGWAARSECPRRPG